MRHFCGVPSEIQILLILGRSESPTATAMKFLPLYHLYGGIWRKGEPAARVPKCSYVMLGPPWTFHLKHQRLGERIIKPPSRLFCRNNLFQHFHRAIHQSVVNACAQRQLNVPYLVHLAEHFNMPPVPRSCSPGPNHQYAGVICAGMQILHS